MLCRAVVLGREPNNVARLRMFVLVLVAVTMVVLAWSAPAHAYRVFVTTNAGAPFSGVGSVASISTGTDALDRPTLELGKGAKGIAVTPDGRRAYASNHYEAKVSVIDTASNTRAAADIDVGGYPDEVKVTPDGSTVYVANHRDGVVTVIDPATNKVVGAGIPIGSPSIGGTYSIAITPDGTRAYVTNAVDSTASVIDTATNTVIGPVISLGADPIDIEVTPDGSRAYVVHPAGSVSVIDTATNTVVGPNISVGDSPDAIAISPDGSRAYVANYGDNDVSVINTLTNSLAGPDIPVGGRPSGLAFTPDGARVYVTNQASRSVSVIDTATNAPAGPDISTPGGLPYGIAIASVPPGPPTPVLAKQVNVEPVKGKVTTKCKGDKRFIRLKYAEQIPVGCLVDTTKGTVELTSSSGAAGGTQSAKFWSGIFKVTQTKSKKPDTELKLAGSIGCSKPKKRRSASALLSPALFAATSSASNTSGATASRRKGGRKLWGSGKGKYKTKGKYGSASVRGTTWLVQDSCDNSTLFRVSDGVVKVRDFVKKKDVTLKKGGRYVARAGHR